MMRDASSMIHIINHIRSGSTVYSLYYAGVAQLQQPACRVSNAIAAATPRPTPAARMYTPVYAPDTSRPSTL